MNRKRNVPFSDQKRYGEVPAYDPEHRFHTGGAHEIRLAGSEQVRWLGERVVEKG